MDTRNQPNEEEDTPLSDEDIRNEAVTILFAGHDTTSVSLTWTFYLIALHSEVQQKISNEIESLIFSNNNKNKKIEWDDLNKLQYISLVIKESHRLFPPLPSNN